MRADHWRVNTLSVLGGIRFEEIGLTLGALRLANARRSATSLEDKAGVVMIVKN
jgi:hypothetical protein